MPPRFAYWTILVGGLPTAFRAAERDEIEPTFKRLQQKHPDAEIRWFARGKLWASPEESSEALARQKAQGKRQNEGFPDRRDRNWRPGGSHRDPRQPYIDAKKRENQRKRERRFEFKKQGHGPQATGHGRPELRHKAQGTRHREESWPSQRPGPKPWRDGAKKPWRDGEKRHTTHSTWRKEEREPWRRPPKPKWQDRARDEGPKAQGAGSKDEQKPWQRPSKPKWNDRPAWKRPPDDDKPEKRAGGKPDWKGGSSPAAWSPKPGARNRPPRKGPRGPR